MDREEYLSMSNTEKEFKGLQKTILLELKIKLEEIIEFPYDFNSNALHDTIHSEVDGFVTGFSREDSIKWIDFCDNEEFIDKGIVDNSTLDRTLITTAFECIRQKLFDDNSLFYDLQEYELTKANKNKFIERIDEYTKTVPFRKIRNDSKSQMWLDLNFELTVDDFKIQQFTEEQIVDLHDGIKILTNSSPSRTEINKNAIVIETDKKPARMYLMQMDKNLDVRDFFKYKDIKSADYSLDPNCYIEGGNDQPPHRQHIKNYKHKFDDKDDFMKYIINMSNKLVDMSIANKKVATK